MNIKDFMPGWQNHAPKAVWLKLVLLLLVGFAANVGQAQTNFASAQPISGVWGSVINDNTGVKPDIGAPNNAGFAPNAPLWYAWTAPQDGVVEMDTVGSAISYTYLTVVGYDPITQQYTLATNTYTANIDTVLGVYTGTSLKTLNQVAANDDLFPINQSYTTSQAQSAHVAQITESGNADYGQSISQYGRIGGGGSSGTTLSEYSFIQPYYGPSGLRFNAKGGQTYYIAVDSKSGTGSTLGTGSISMTGPIHLNWAYKPSGVFRFASEDMDYWSGLLLYQTAETESMPIDGTDNSGNSTVLTYYGYNALGVLVTVTRVAGSTGRAMVDYTTVDGTNLPPGSIAVNDMPGVAGIDYTPVSGTLVFDDFEMSKTILIPINYLGSGIVGGGGGRGFGGDQTNRVFGIKLIDDGGNTSPVLDPLEAADVSQPRVDSTFSTAMVRILNVNADPYGPDLIENVSTNGYLDAPTNTIPNLVTNLAVALYPTNVVFNFEKANYRVPADVNDPNVSPWTKVTLWVERYGTNGAATTLNYRVNNILGNDGDASEEENNLFPAPARLRLRRAHADNLGGGSREQP